MKSCAAVKGSKEGLETLLQCALQDVSVREKSKCRPGCITSYLAVRKENKQRDFWLHFFLNGKINQNSINHYPQGELKKQVEGTGMKARPL